MTSFGTMFRALNRNKFSLINQIFLVELLAVVVSALWTLVTGHFSSMTLFYSFISWGSIAWWVAFILLSRKNEQTFMQDTYRLVPIGDGGFYGANVLSSLVELLYFSVVQAVVLVITMLIGGMGNVDSDMHAFLNGFFDGSGWHAALSGMPANWPWLFLGMVIVALGILLLVWTTITLIHFLTSVISNFLPRGRQRVVLVILYIVVIWLVTRIISLLVMLYTKYTSGFVGAHVASQIYLAAGAIVILLVLEVVANIFLLKKWVETQAN